MAWLGGWRCMGSRSVGWWSRQTLDTAVSPGGSLGSVVVTHPFHPLRGHRLDVLQTRRWGASRMYVCDGGLFGSVVLSEEATDRGPEAAERPLTLEVLAGLAVLVADLAGERGVAR